MCSGRHAFPGFVKSKNINRRGRRGRRGPCFSMARNPLCPLWFAFVDPCKSVLIRGEVCFYPSCPFVSFVVKPLHFQSALPLRLCASAVDFALTPRAPWCPLW